MSRPVSPGVQQVVAVDENGSPIFSADAAKVDDPDATEATVIGLLRGILAELQAQTALMEE